MMIRELADLPESTMNQVLDIQPTNTLFQLGTHVAASTRYWTITCTGGKDYHRNRPAEFTAVGSKAEVLANLEALIEEVEAHLSRLSADQHNQPVTVNAASLSMMDSAEPLRQRQGVLHALEHIGLHLGHVQITRQLLGFAPPPDED